MTQAAILTCNSVSQRLLEMQVTAMITHYATISQTHMVLPPPKKKNITHFDRTSTPGVQDTHLRHSTRMMFSTRDCADHLLTENHHTNHHKYAEHIGNCEVQTTDTREKMEKLGTAVVHLPQFPPAKCLGLQRPHCPGHVHILSERRKRHVVHVVHVVHVYAVVFPTL